jgi:hypothetical protein
MRTRFLTYLGMGVVSAFLIVASYAFVAGTFMWLAFAGGIVLAVLGIAEVAVSRGRPMLAGPATVVALLGVVMAILAVSIATGSVADWAFGLAIATAGLSVLGLLGHEVDAEHQAGAIAPMAS